MPTQSLNEPMVDFLILADRAESVNGKLYMMGGGWDRLLVADFTQAQPISIGMGIMVPWNATNMGHTLVVRVESQDGTELAMLTLGFNAGRPPTLGQGESQKIVLAFQIGLLLPGPGAYVIRAFIDDHERSGRTVFYANLLPGPRAVSPRPPL